MYSAVHSIEDSIVNLPIFDTQALFSFHLAGDLSAIFRKGPPFNNFEQFGAFLPCRHCICTLLPFKRYIYRPWFQLQPAWAENNNIWSFQVKDMSGQPRRSTQPKTQKVNNIIDLQCAPLATIVLLLVSPPYVTITA